MAILYSDYDLQAPIEGTILFEGVTYYLDIENHSEFIITKWMDDEHIESCVENYHPKNKVLIIRFDNIVGYVNILGKEYDVRSNKFLDGLEGNAQFQTLLDEISILYSKLSFSYRGTSYARRENENEYNLNDLDVFDYYNQLAFMFPTNANLDTLIAQCLKSPNTINIQSTEDVRFEKSKRLSSNFYKNIGSIRNLADISESHSLANSAFTIMTNKKISKRLLPSVVTDSSFVKTTNTTENRFLKYFLEEINGLCVRLINQRSDLDLSVKAKKLQKKVSTYLLNPFFKNIQRLTYIPSSSSVLLKKAGYRDIYHHFVQSKFAFKPILDNHKKYALKYGLKNIATLYEIWVFLRLAQSMFGGKLITEMFEGQIQKNGVMMGAYRWRADNVELYYNKVFSRSNGGSYSVTLRPDISLNVSGNLYLFDAKYKFNSNNADPDLLVRVVKPEDIHKMHSYLDAIHLAKSAMVIYPGTELIFYHRDEHSPDLFRSGVGAIPLSPNYDNNLHHVLEIFKEQKH